MIRNFFVTTFRNLAKYKAFSFINIFGMAIGIAACLLIQQYVRFERSYEAFNPLADRIYRLQLNRYNEGKVSTQWAAGAAGIGKAIKDGVPEVETFAKLTTTGGVVSYNNEKYREEKMYFANDAFYRCSLVKCWRANGLEHWPNRIQPLLQNQWQNATLETKILLER